MRRILCKFYFTQVKTSYCNSRMCSCVASYHSTTRNLSRGSSATNADPNLSKENIPFRFETGIALYAKKKPRPFPPPFHSPPRSFSDPTNNHESSSDKCGYFKGKYMKGFTNGDDAVYADNYFIAVNDGVGAWSTRPGGHAGLWSRLVMHFWALEIENNLSEPDPIRSLQNAYEQSIIATAEPNNWQGTTTATGALMYYKNTSQKSGAQTTPLLFIVNLGDSQILVTRPRESRLVFKSTQQWHWYDCPRQLGTNSPDTPCDKATLDLVEIEENDIILAVSDGVTDNLWEHEIIKNVVDSVNNWKDSESNQNAAIKHSGEAELMRFVADELLKAAKAIATDPFAESPFMEQAIKEGLAVQGGKLDDISVVAAICKRSRTPSLK
ncbi:putative protein phosphatase 2C 80 [Golovinomyces cichoracearum]|uniref:Protein phosphatase n=1 Tax=Golovinomyces cichoracearum TaxID=62708 RepID=A0A420IF32_9PEZI|nr:putative protein phosphatase 2C 80 [Golovinomyces cichoracearum]